MKALAVLLISLIATNTHASWMATKCSNSDGTVTWESGHDLNEINLKYANFYPFSEQRTALYGRSGITLCTNREIVKKSQVTD